MKPNGWFSSDRTDRALTALSLIGILLCALLLVSEKAFHRFFGDSRANSADPVIGEISFAKNDIRHRSSDSLSWEKANSEQEIRVGDSVFSGEKSQSRVILKDGAIVDLDQNSLVKFTRIDNIELPNLALGNFKVAVNGSMKIAIDGEVTEIKGKGSEVQVILRERGKAKVRLLRGSAQVRTKTVTRDLEADKIVAVRELEPPPPAPQVILPDHAPPPPPEPKVLAKFADGPFEYTDELYDLFDFRSGKLIRREQRRAVVSHPIHVRWLTDGVPTQVFGQLSATPDFSNIPESFNEVGAPQGSTFKRSLLGLNYFRISIDGKTWSRPEAFTVVAKSLDERAPRLRLHGSKLYILEKSIVLAGDILSAFPRHTLEYSESPEFPSSGTQAVWMTTKTFQMSVSEPKSIFIRVRGVDPNMKITGVSETVRVDIEKPEPPEAPRLANDETRIFEGEEAELRWRPANRANRYQVVVVDSKNKIIERRVGRSETLKISTLKIGTYRIKVRSEDAFGRPSKEIAEAKLSVLPKPVPVVAIKEREPANEGTSIQKMETSIPNYLNRNYESSSLRLEGAAFTMYSQDQIQGGNANPTAFMAGVRWFGWRRANGVETSFKTKTVDISSTPGASVAPIQLEARYHHRWTMPFNFFSKFRQSKISLLAGYEYYRNPGGGLFSPGYELVKAGFSLAFPLSYRWDTGGEVLYGQGLESSSKYEISGYIHYYLEKWWSFGVGYRVHLFQAGSREAAPVALPYREGFGEGYSVLRWHY